MPDPSPYDALLLVSFGGPERPEDVVPFLRNVTKGKDIPDERLEEVGEHYYAFGGKSPINDQNRLLLDAIRSDFEQVGLDLPVYWGNRNWDPYLTDAITQMRDDGITRALAITTSAYSSYSGCRQYRENLHDSWAEVEGAPVIDRARAYFNHPGFVDSVADAALAVLAEFSETERRALHLLFVTHSIPTSMDAVSGPDGHAYVQQHEELMAEVAMRIRMETGHSNACELVYCSRSGPPQMPWLEPDVNDRMREIAAMVIPAVALVPFGFISDHMEVIYDLDTEARDTAKELGIGFARADTSGVHPRFVAMFRDLLLERAASERGDQVQREVAFGEPTLDVCAPGCCANPRGWRPTLGGAAEQGQAEPVS